MVSMIRDRAVLAMAVCFMLAGSMGGCARLPYTTKVVHEDHRVVVVLQREIDAGGHAHPVQLTAGQVAALLRGFSIREQQRLPLRWFAEESPPKKIFREDELHVLAPQLAEALGNAGPDERVYFKLLAPGLSPSYRYDVVGGWMAVHDRLLHLTMDYFHVQQPTKTTDA